MTHWTIKVEEDPETGELILPFPPDLLSSVGWDEGTVIVWEEMNNGSWLLKKKEEDGRQDNPTE